MEVFLVCKYVLSLNYELETNPNVQKFCLFGPHGKWFLGLCKWMQAIIKTMVRYENDQLEKSAFAELNEQWLEIQCPNSLLMQCANIIHSSPPLPRPSLNFCRCLNVRVWCVHNVDAWTQSILGRFHFDGQYSHYDNCARMKCEMLWLHLHICLKHA